MGNIMDIIVYILIGICILIEVYHILLCRKISSFLKATERLLNRGRSSEDIDKMNDEQFLNESGLTERDMKIYQINSKIDSFYWFILFILIFVMFPIGAAIFVAMFIMSIISWLARTIFAIGERYHGVSMVVITDAITSILIYIMAILKYYH